MSKKRIRFIVNPFSGTSSKENLQQLIANNLDQNIYDPDIKYTQAAGHAITLSKQAVEENIDVIVAVGGDGSVNEVAQSLIHSNSTLGVLPGGSGNGFAMHLGVGRSIEKAFQYINNGNIETIDTCLLNEKPFVNVAGIGFDARIAFLTKENKKRGFLPYLLTTIKESKNFKPTPMSILVDGKKIEDEFAAAVVANASMYGYYFTIAPPASLIDGKLDLLLIKKAPVYQYFMSSIRFLNRTLHLSKLVSYQQASQIQIQVHVPSHVHVDGEGHIAPEMMDFKIVPKSLKVLTGKVR